MTDRYRGKDFTDALQALKQRFPEGNLDYHPVGGDVFVTLPLSDGGSFRAALKWEQAKYLAYTRLTSDEVKEDRFPPDWPD
jgi:hypothetical protein